MEALGFISSVFSLLGQIFSAPIRHPELLWITIPIWVSWFFGEFFQEKHKTLFGNVIGNSIVSIFVVTDWLRLLSKSESTPVLFYVVCGAILMHSCIVLYLALKAVKIAKYIGHIRTVTYVLLVATPVAYGIIPLSWTYAVSFVVGLLIFWIGFEIADRVLPDPRSLRDDEGHVTTSFDLHSK